jgi:hypothetical protein
MARAKPASRPVSLPVFRQYGSFRVIDGSAEQRSQIISDDLQALVRALQRKREIANRNHHLMEQYAGGAGENHPSREADMALWTEHHERWEAAADAVAAYEVRNVYEAAFKARATAFDVRGVIADGLAQQIANMFGGDT